ncbi:aldose 1-epimerase [Dyella aluminiiresistens]|uniref:aldose 1-epimerase n=1 Tax=Dyella aluminiiresistens TaxID=3069105 RepID=UPI00399CD728
MQVLAEAGGGIAGFDWHGRNEPISLMRRYKPSGHRIDPNQLSCFPLVPWSNRISDNGFEVEGRWIPLSSNREDEPWPIHGSGWQRAWQVTSHTTHEIRLSLTQRSATAYCYEASLQYTLLEDALQVDMAVTNIASLSMPFGLGLHPFFNRGDSVRLMAPASNVWLNNGQTPLPTQYVDIPPEWDFRAERALPEQGIDNAFQGWTGEAVIHWPGSQLGLRIDAGTDAFVLYTPADRDFFCFEPVDHPINAVHLPGGPDKHGMTMLSPRATLQRRFVFSVLDMPKD